MQLIKVDPRALKENPDRMRQTKSTPQADALLLATIKAVGIVQPPVITPETGGGNGYVINAGHRRVKQAIAAGLEEIDVLVDEAANDNGAMRSMIENIAREALNPVDQWRAIERLVALGWTEEAIGVALALPVRQIRKLRLLANVLPAMLDHMAKGDMPEERQLRTIASASLDEQKEVWKKHKPSKADPQVSWFSVAQALTKARMYARDASFGDDLAQAYGIQWAEDLFAPADEDSRYTTDVEAFLGAQQEWMTNNLPKRGVIAETTNWGEVKLPPKAERVYGKPSKSDCTAMYLDRDGRVQSVHYRMPAAKKATGKGAAADSDAADESATVSKPRPDMTRKGLEMIGDFRTDALHEALARAPIEDDTLMALVDPRLRQPERLGRFRKRRDLLRQPAHRPPCRGAIRSGWQARPRHRHAPRRGALNPHRKSCRAGRTAPTAASSPASPVTWSARTTSCRTWAPTISCRACRAPRSKARARTRRFSRARR